MPPTVNCSVGPSISDLSERCIGESLDLLLREKRLSEAKAREKFRQMVLAVEYIHSKNIVCHAPSRPSLLFSSELFSF